MAREKVLVRRTEREPVGMPHVAELPVDVVMLEVVDKLLVGDHLIVVRVDLPD